MMTNNHSLCTLAATTTAHFANCCHIMTRSEMGYLGDIINTSSLIWAAGELLRVHTYHLLSNVSDELVAVKSCDKSCDHGLYPRTKTRCAKANINGYFFCYHLPKWNCTVWNKKRDHSGTWWWVNVFSCELKSIHHGVTAVTLGKGIKTVERNYWRLKIRMQNCNQIHIENECHSLVIQLGDVCES